MKHLTNLKEKEHSYGLYYAMATLLCVIIAFVYIYINGGSAISRWMFEDVWDTGNDFFNCIPGVKGYGVFSSLSGYPPLANLLLLIIAHIYSYNNIPLETTIRHSMTDPRMQQAALFQFLIFIIVCCAAIIMIVNYIFKNSKYSYAICASTLGVYSVVFAVERGNLILLAFVFLLFFVAFYKSENKILREAALIALALSFGLKYYPAAFGLLLVYEKRWKEALRAIIYGVIAYVLPLLMISGKVPATGGKFLDNIISNYTAYFDKLMRLDIVGVVVIIEAIVATLIMLVASFFKKNNKKWITFYYLGILTITVGLQFAEHYVYVFLIPSLLIFFKEEKRLNLKTVIDFIFLCIINLPLPIFGVPHNLRLPLVAEIKMYSACIMAIYLAIYSFLKREKRMVDDCT